MSNELYNNTNMKIFSNNLFEFSCYDTSAIIIKVKNAEIESVNVPEYFNNEGNIYKVIAIGKKAFENFKKLTTVTLPNSVIIIDDEAFNNCYNIESINIENVLLLGNLSFGNCKKLKSVTINKGCIFKRIPFAYTNVENINVMLPNGEVVNNGNVKTKYNDDKIIQLACKNSDFSRGFTSFNKFSISCSNVEKLILPNGFESVGDYFATGTNALKEVTLSDTIKNVGKYAFSNCINLSKLTIKNGVENIGEKAFKKCDALIQVILPNSIENIGEKAFFECRNLEKITLSNSLKVIKNSAFKSCNLKSVVIPPSVLEIESDAFKNNRELESVYISNKSTKIHPNAFDKKVKILEF